jgi:hypothetical protein
MGHEIDMVVDTGIHHTWRSQDLNNERLWGGRLCADHVPSGVMIKLGERSCRYNEGIKGMSRSPFIGQGREREGMNEQEWPAMKVL